MNIRYLIAFFITILCANISMANPEKKGLEQCHNEHFPGYYGCPSITNEKKCNSSYIYHVPLAYGAKGAYYNCMWVGKCITARKECSNVPEKSSSGGWLGGWF